MIYSFSSLLIRQIWDKPLLYEKRDFKKLRQEVVTLDETGFISGNLVKLLRSGDAYFPALEKALNEAKYEIYLETYIFENDNTGRSIAAALSRAKLRGVKVHVLIDGYGSKNLPKSVLDKLQANGVETHIFRPLISPWTLRRKRLRRMHRKIVVVDREVAFVGGINIIDDKEDVSSRAPRLDYAVEVSGPLVEVIRKYVQKSWLTEVRETFGKETIQNENLLVSNSQSGGVRAAFVVRDNFHHRRDIESEYMRAINQAESEILLAHAYFLPGYHFRQALVDAAARGVRVALLVQGQTEYFLEHFGSRALFGSLLNGGVEIFEYGKGFLHAKVAVIDRYWATVGSSNIDPFSLLLSLEGNVVVADESFGATLAKSLKKTLEKDCQQILMDRWKQQPLALRLICWISYGILRLMKGISGYDRENEPTNK